MNGDKSLFFFVTLHFFVKWLFVWSCAHTIRSAVSSVMFLPQLIESIMLQSLSCFGSINDSRVLVTETALTC